MFTFTLPVQIGTETFVPHAYLACKKDGSRYVEAEIIKGKVSMLQQKKDGTWKFRTDGVTDFTLDAIGKTVFLNQADAENELRRKVKEF